MNQLPLRGVLAPVFLALGLAAGILNLRLTSPVMLFLGLGFLTLGLVFARDTRRLLSDAFKD